MPTIHSSMIFYPHRGGNKKKKNAPPGTKIAGRPCTLSVRTVHEYYLYSQVG